MSEGDAAACTREQINHPWWGVQRWPVPKAGTELRAGREGMEVPGLICQQLEFGWAGTRSCAGHSEVSVQCLPAEPVSRSVQAGLVGSSPWNPGQQHWGASGWLHSACKWSSGECLDKPVQKLDCFHS